MATVVKALTKDWQEVATGACLMQKKGSGIVDLMYADAAPADEAIGLTIESTDIQAFPAPSSGSIYARTNALYVTLIVTEV